MNPLLFYLINRTVLIRKKSSELKIDINVSRYTDY